MHFRANFLGLIRQPKYGHLRDLHKAIKLCERALLSAEPTVKLLGSYEQVCHVQDYLNQVILLKIFLFFEELRPVCLLIDDLIKQHSAGIYILF